MAVKLPPLVQSIVLDPSGVRAGAPAIAKGFQTTTTSATKATSAVGALDKSLYSMSFRMQTVGRIMMKGFGLPILAAAGLAVNSFGKFEKELVKIEGLVGVSERGVESFAQSIKEVGRATGRAPQELAEAMFFVASAGLRGSVAMEVLRASAKGAAIGLGQTKSIVDAATSAVNAYGAENLSGSDAVDVLTAAVREGKVEAERLAPAIGKAIPVASAMGIEFHEVAAAIAAMTRTGTDARTSAIQLRQIMQSLLDPSRQTEKALREMGIAQGELADQARERGLLSVLKRLRDLAEENEEAFADVFPNIRALAGALDITGENLAENEQIFAALADSTGDTDSAFRNLEETVAFRFNKAITDLKIAFIEMGESMTPLVTGFEMVFKVTTKFIKVITNTPIGSFILALGAATAAGGLFMVVLGKMIQSMLFFNGGVARATVATFAFSKSLGAAGAKGLIANVMKLAKGPAGLAMLAVTAATVGLSFLLMRKRAESTAEKLGKIRAQINDVKAVADISIKPMHDYAQAIRGIAEASSADPTIFQSWTDQFGEMVDNAEDLGIRGQDNKVIQTIIRTFGGQENTQAMRDSFAALWGRLAVDYKSAFEDEFLQSIFGTASQEEIMGILLDTEGQGGTIALARTVVNDNREQIQEAARAATTEYDRIIERFLEGNKTELGGGRGAVALQNWIDAWWQTVVSPPRQGAIHWFMTPAGDPMQMQKTAAMQLVWEDQMQKTEDGIRDAANGMEDVADEFIQAMSSGKWEVMSDMYKGMIQGFLDTTDMEGKELEMGLFAWQRALQTALAEADNFEQDLNRSGGLSRADNLVEWFQRVTAEGEKFLISQENWDTGGFFEADEVRNWKDMVIFGQILNQVIADLADDKDGIRAVFENSGLEETVFLIEVAAERMLAMQKEIDDTNPLGLRTVEEAFEALATEMAEATAEGKRFKDKFDLLTQSAWDFQDAQIGMVDGLQSFANAARDSGGSMDILTSKGRKTRGTLIDAAKGAIEFAQAGVATGEFSQAEGVKIVEDAIANLEATAKLWGVSAEDFQGIMATMTATNFSLVAAPEDTLISNQDFDNTIDALEQGIIGFMDFTTMKNLGTQAIAGWKLGYLEEAQTVEQVVADFMDKVESWHKIESETKSPSIRFAREVGRPITAGIAKGMLDERSKIRFTIKELVNETISEAQNTIGTVNRAIVANLDLETARVNLKNALRDFGREGEITKRESLTRKQLERDLADAERAMRLGTGHQEDLELSLLDAQQALEEFDANVTSGAPTTQATVDLLQAGLQMGEAVAKMKMEGDKAIELFTNLGETMGLPMDEITSALAVAESNIDVYRNMFDDEVLDAIERAADAFIIISQGGKGDAQIIADPLSGRGYDWGTGDPFTDEATKQFLTEQLGIGMFDEGSAKGKLTTNLMGLLGGIGYGNQITRSGLFGTEGITMADTPEVTELKTIDETLHEGFGMIDWDLQQLIMATGKQPARPFTENYGYRIDFTSTDPNDYAGWAGGLQ